MNELGLLVNSGFSFNLPAKDGIQNFGASANLTLFNPLTIRHEYNGEVPPGQLLDQFVSSKGYGASLGLSLTNGVPLTLGPTFFLKLGVPFSLWVTPKLGINLIPTNETRGLQWGVGIEGKMALGPVYVGTDFLRFKDGSITTSLSAGLIWAMDVISPAPTK